MAAVPTAFKKFEPRACERCGKSHICTLTTHCPCMDAEVSEKLLEKISRYYEDCLCANCLKEMALESKV
jgi:ribosomal protein L34E